MTADPATLPTKRRRTRPQPAPREGGIFGPHFFYDLIRLARGKRVRDLRMLYTFAILLALLLLYMARFRWLSFEQLFFGGGQAITATEQGLFAQRFIIAVLFVQNLAVFLLAPIYLGSCITEEKERRSIDLLFISRLHDHEILLGKLGSRMVHLGGVLLAGLPILSMAQLMGGIDMYLLVINFINTFFNLLAVGCFSLLMSAVMNKTLHAVMTVYGVLLPLMFVFGAMSLGGSRSSPFGFMAYDMPELTFAMIWWLLTLAVSAISLLIARVSLRKHASMPPPRWAEPPRTPRVSTVSKKPEKTIRIVRSFHVPPVGAEPLLWKEYYFGPRPHTTVLFWAVSTALVFAPFGGGALLFLLSAATRNGPPGLNAFGGMVRFYVVGLAVFFCFWSAFRAAATLARERQHKTLDDLLTVPLDRETILGWKWLGSIFHGWIFAAFCGAVVAIGCLTTATHIAAGIFVTGSVLVHVAFWTTLGLYFSTVCQTVLAAYMRLGLTFFFVVFTTFLFAATINFSRDDWVGYYVSCGLNPLATWWTLGFTRHQYEQFLFSKAQVVGSLLGVFTYALMGLCLWLLTVSRFRREQETGRG